VSAGAFRVIVPFPVKISCLEPEADEAVSM
jgi:hypothetical protein